MEDVGVRIVEGGEAGKAGEEGDLPPYLMNLPEVRGAVVGAIVAEDMPGVDEGVVAPLLK